jgi:hypothetical protein
MGKSLLVGAAGSHIPESALPRNSPIRSRAFEVMRFRTDPYLVPAASPLRVNLGRLSPRFQNLM